MYKNFFHNAMNKKNNIKNVLLLLLLQVVILLHVNAQTIKISGKITSSRFPVQNASVTFIDESDTTRQFSAVTDNQGNYQVGLVTSVGSNSGNVPNKFKLGQSYPNPFSSTAAIPYGLNEESNVQVTIFDILGRVVRKFEVGYQSTGTHNIIWDGRNNLGQKVASGVYLYKLKANGESQVKKMVFDQNGSGVIPIPHSFSLTEKTSVKKINKIQNAEGNIFIIRVQNTSNTTPLIVPLEENNVVIQNDTTINFSVASIPSAAIDFDSLHQIIRGFGAANIVGWRPDMTADEIETAFGTADNQLGFSILRLRISPNSNDFGNNVATAKAAYDMGVKIIASPWTPPASMKTNNNLVGGELREDAYDDYTAHLNSFVDFMSDNDVPIYAVSVQNEPDIEVNYESCDWSPEQMVKFMRENAPDVGTRVMAPESFQFRRNMSDPILNDPVASSNLDIVAGHIYGGGLAAYPLAEEKGKEIWMTEHLTESAHSANIWSLALDVAEEMQSVMKANMNAYIWWYIVRYYGPIGDGESSADFPNEDFAEKGEVTKKGYVMSQFARFIRPGFYRVESSISPPLSDVSVTAYKDPSSSKVVIVAVNSGSTEAETVFRIRNSAMTTTYTPYTTNIALNCEEGNEFTVTEDSFSYTLLPLSITTFVSD